MSEQPTDPTSGNASTTPPPPGLASPGDVAKTVAGTSETKRPAAVFIGMMGAGKSTIARIVGRAKGLRVLDVDRIIEERNGCSAADIFAQHGEAEFRRQEQATTIEALQSSGCVVALGGGGVENPHIQQALSGHRVVYLMVSQDAVFSRIRREDNRPMLAGDAEQRWRDLMARRRELYENLAWLTVATDHRRPDDIATEVLAALDQPLP